MNSDEATEMLCHIAAFDKRTIGDADGEAWAAALAGVPYDQSTREAIALFYATAPGDAERGRWMQPHHVRTYRSRIRERRQAALPHVCPNEVEGVNSLDELRALRRAIGDGRIADADALRKYEAWGGSMYLQYQRELVSGATRQGISA